VDGQESARVGAIDRNGMEREARSADRLLPMESIRVRKRAPRAVPVKRAWAKGPPG
jgi:hypothetical protein